MTDDRSPSASGATVGALMRSVEALRDDMREDIGHLRDDVREDNAALERRVMTALGDFSLAHGREHLEERETSAVAHKRFDEFMDATRLAQARRDGALGVVRFVVELLSRHSPQIVKVLVAAGTVIAFASGAIHFEVSIR